MKPAVVALLRFKLDKAHARVAGGGAASLAADVGARLGCGAAPCVFPPARRLERTRAAFGLDAAWYACAVGGPAASVRTYDALAAFLDGGDHDGVAVVEPGLIAEGAWIPNEPAFMGRQWLVSNAMNLDEAWDEATGSSDVVVQVVDTGTPAGHEDLAGALWTNDEEICENGVDDDGNGFVDDCHGYDFFGASGSVEPSPDYSERDHGAHCAGIVAAVSNNGVGVAGVAGGDGSPGSGARLMTAKVVGAAGAFSGMAAALVPDTWLQSDLDAIDYGQAKGVIYVFSATNGNNEARLYPAAYAGVVAVTNVDYKGVRRRPRHHMADYGDWIDVVAPGVSIYSTLIDGYGLATGTSQATPFVAGALALAYSRAPDVSREALLNCLFATARTVDAANPGYEGKLGDGMVDAAALLACACVETPSCGATTTTAAAPADACAGLKKSKCKKKAATCEFKKRTCRAKCAGLEKSKCKKKKATCEFKKKTCRAKADCAALEKKKECKASSCKWRSKTKKCKAK
ncbi:serine-type endopeptidase [Aureococcus anophagefferens]|uniref:subtilisin n=1 Tax=Aureococcus anophagefferens TaxID=44056 RepID=A0ABR1FRH1_AURAN